MTAKWIYVSQRAYVPNMGFLVFAGKTLAGIGCILGSLLFGGAFVLVGIFTRETWSSIIGGIIVIVGLIAGFYLLARSRHEL